MASSDVPQTSEMTVAELENAFGFRSLLAAMALVFLTIGVVLLGMECAALNAAGKYTPVKTSEEDNTDNDNHDIRSNEKRVQDAARP